MISLADIMFSTGLKPGVLEARPEITMRMRAQRA
jgi:hypothetical protein